MDIGEQFSLEHLLFRERKCTSCGKNKNLIEDFYMTRKSKKGHPSAYACKDCTVKRVMASRKKRDPFADWGYPDW